ncbi:MBL fold metallo-hydrolase [Bacillus sp. BA3]|uniref:MBL fold metallo-hydrolase n=1 Tax=Bacillus sp. BA3 TaxID=2057910 RepID=UPI0012FEDAB8|nr:MBL fold metallo-hydrolase [Bacillus sp. BA3]
MNYRKIGPVEIIMGENNSHVPFSTSLIIRGQEHSTLIDCGAGRKAFNYLQKEHNVKQIYLTHHHVDHIWGAQLFTEAEKFINPFDIKKVSDIHEILKSEGFYAVFGKEDIKELVQKQQNREYQDHIIGKRTLDVHSTYSYDLNMKLSDTNVIMIHSPGHTEGYCCPYLTDYGILFVGDFDLSSFGPFYCDAESNIDNFIESARKTLDVEAKYFVTSHHKGIFLKDEYKKGLNHYLDIIERREEKIKRFIKAGYLPRELANQEIFYYKNQYKRSPLFIKSEKIGIVKHLVRLIKNGEPFKDFLTDFILAFNMSMENTEYKSEINDSTPCRNYYCG